MAWLRALPPTSFVNASAVDDNPCNILDRDRMASSNRSVCDEPSANLRVPQTVPPDVVVLVVVGLPPSSLQIVAAMNVTLMVWSPWLWPGWRRHQRITAGGRQDDGSASTQKCGVDLIVRVRDIFRWDPQCSSRTPDWIGSRHLHLLFIGSTDVLYLSTPTRWLPVLLLWPYLLLMTKTW